MVSPERPELGSVGVRRRIGESLACRAEMCLGGHVLALLGQRICGSTSVILGRTMFLQEIQHNSGS